MKKLILVPVMMAALALGACTSTDGMGNKQLIGTGSGALLGGLAGSQLGKGSGQLWATGAGVLLGALVGSDIGQSLDKADQQYATQANQKAIYAPVGETVTWNNPQTGNSGTITPTRDGYSSSGRYCREYQQTVTVGGRNQTAYGQACQSPNGDWEIVK